MKYIDYVQLSPIEKFTYKLSSFFKAIPGALAGFFSAIGKFLKSFVQGIGNFFKDYATYFKTGGPMTKLSYVVMGAGCLAYGQVVKGIIFLLDDLEVTRKKIMSAVTDSDNKVIYDEENKPGISNLLMIYSSMTNMSIKEAEEKFKDYNYGNFKKEVADSVINRLHSFFKHLKIPHIISTKNCRLHCLKIVVSN